MTYYEISCGNCGAKYQLYFDGSVSQTCPHCLAKIPDKAFKKMQNALYCLEEINKDMRVAHSESQLPLFQAELKNHYVPQVLFNR